MDYLSLLIKGWTDRVASCFYVDYLTREFKKTDGYSVKEFFVGCVLAASEIEEEFNRQIQQAVGKDKQAINNKISENFTVDLSGFGYELKMTYYDIEFLKKFISEARENLNQAEQEEPEEPNESEIKPLPYKDQFEFTSDDLGILKGYSAREVSEIMFFLNEHQKLSDNPYNQLKNTAITTGVDRSNYRRYWREESENIEALNKNDIETSYDTDKQKAREFIKRLNTYYKLFEYYPFIQQDIIQKIDKVKQKISQSE